MMESIQLIYVTLDGVIQLYSPLFTRASAYPVHVAGNLIIKTSGIKHLKLCGYARFVS